MPRSDSRITFGECSVAKAVATARSNEARYQMLILVNDLGAIARAKATVLQFGYAAGWPIEPRIGSVEPQCLSDWMSRRSQAGERNTKTHTQ
jgi:hypothetical protein